MLQSYEEQARVHEAAGLAPLLLDAEQTTELVKLLENPPAFEESYLYELLADRIPPGVNEAAHVKADFLLAIVQGRTISPIIGKQRAVELLGAMQADTTSTPRSSG